jgi:coproporphyrinogen III oxidase
VSFVVSKNVIFANGYGKQELFRQWSDRLFYLPHREPYAEGVGFYTLRRTGAARAQNSQSKATNYGTTQATTTETSVANEPSSINSLNESNKKKHP